MRQITLNIDSNPDSVDLADECIRALCLLTPLSSATVDGVRQAVKEAVNNVIIHSYNGEPNRPIMLTLSIQEEQLSIALRDTGSGMEPALLETDTKPVFDPADISQIPNGGWGVYLIKELMDKVSYYSEAGTHTLEMIKFLPTRDTF